MHDLLIGTAYTLFYYVLCAGVALSMRKLIRIPDEIFRKLLHCILLGSLLVYVFAFKAWQHSAFSCILFAAIVYPILRFFERFDTYSKMTTERKKGELKNSLLIVFSMFALVISVCWGWLDDRLLALASVYAWGFGDAAAALIGKRFGKHRIPNSVKSFEGTLSMFLISFLCVLIILLLRGGVSPFGCVLTAALVAAASAVTELRTPGGYDTITCPIIAMAVLLPMIHLFGGGI